MLKKSTVFAYADDLAIIVKHKCINTAVSIMQDEFNSVSRWCHDQGLVINAVKTKLMHIRMPRQPEVSISIHHQNEDCPTTTKSDAIEIVKTIKYLGIIIDEHFLWHEHVNKIRMQLRSAVFAMVYLKRYTSAEVQKQVYLSLAESRLRYGILAWGNASKIHIDKILYLQHRLCKIINTNNTTLRVLDVNGIFKMAMLLHYYDEQRYQQRICHNQNTRRRAQGLLEIPETFNNYGRRHPSYALPELMNQLPANLKNIVNFKKRKKDLKLYLLTLHYVT